MSQDPVTQAPFSTQGLNRYSYVMNNPINATDPSGFLIGSSAGGIGILNYDDGPAWLPYGSDAGAATANVGTGAGLTFGQVVSSASTATSAVGLGVNIVADGLALFNLQGTPDVVRHMTPTATAAGTGSGRGSTTAVGQSSATIRDGLAHRPSACDGGMCLAQSVPGAEGGPGADVRSDGTGGSARAAPASVVPIVLLRLPTWDETLVALGRAVQAVEEAFAVAEMAPAAGVVVPGDSVIVRATPYTDKVGKIAQEAGKHLGRRVTPREINDAIHRVKENLGRGRPIKNPDVLIDPSSGDVRPKIPGGMGDSIGNIFDHL